MFVGSDGKGFRAEASVIVAAAPEVQQIVPFPSLRNSSVSVSAGTWSIANRPEFSDVSRDLDGDSGKEGVAASAECEAAAD
jgi:hypothetical protein